MKNVLATLVAAPAASVLNGVPATGTIKWLNWTVS